MKNEIINMLVAFGICENKKQAASYCKNKTSDQLRNIYQQLKQKAAFAFYND